MLCSGPACSALALHSGLFFIHAHALHPNSLCPRSRAFFGSLFICAYALHPSSLLLRSHASFGLPSAPLSRFIRVLLFIHAHALLQAPILCAHALPLGFVLQPRSRASSELPSSTLARFLWVVFVFCALALRPNPLSLHSHASFGLPSAPLSCFIRVPTRRLHAALKLANKCLPCG